MGHENGLNRDAVKERRFFERYIPQLYYRIHRGRNGGEIGPDQVIGEIIRNNVENGTCADKFYPVPTHHCQFIHKGKKALEMVHMSMGNEDAFYSWKVFSPERVCNGAGINEQ